MNRKKGFTLAELLGAIIVLMLILLLAIPPILNHINKSKGELSGAMENIIFSATDLYIDSNRTEYLKISGVHYCTSLKDLVDNNFLSEPLIDPETMSEIDLNKFVKSTVTNKNYYHEITDSCNEKELVILTVEDLKEDVTTSGDGLYLDDDGIYRYKGNNPNNYINLGDEEYRIMAIEGQGVKVIKRTRATTSPFDACIDGTCTRYNENNTYCQNYLDMNNEYQGCNIYASANQINQNGIVSDTITNGSKIGTVTENSNIYNYLHDTYYSNLSSVNSYIVQDAIWNVGPITYQEPMLLNTIKEDEKQWTWTGKIAIMTISDYVGAQSPNGDEYQSCSENILYNVNCGINNWLKFKLIAEYQNILNPRFDDSFRSWLLNSEGNVTFDYASGSYRAIRPVVYLKSDIKLIGSGTELDPYQILDL